MSVEGKRISQDLFVLFEKWKEERHWREQNLVIELLEFFDKLDERVARLEGRCEEEADDA